MIDIGFDIYILSQFFIDIVDSSENRFDILKGELSIYYNKYEEREKIIEKNK